MYRSKTWIERTEPVLPMRPRIVCPGDVHLCAENRGKALIEILRYLLDMPAEVIAELTIVLNCDFLDITNLAKILVRATKQDLKVIVLIERLRTLGATIRYNLGNHDAELPDLLVQVALRLQDSALDIDSREYRILSTLALIERWKVREMSLLGDGDHRTLFIHGDQWDHIVHKRKLLTNVGSFFWELLKRVDSSKHRVATYAKRSSKLWTKVSHQVATGTIALARHHKASIGVAGHTHDPWEYELDGIRYINLGSFDMHESGLLIEDEHGVVRLHRVYTRNHAIRNPRKK